MTNNQKYTIQFDAQLDINQMKSALGQLQGEFSKLKISPNATKGITETFSKLSDEIRNFETLANKGIKTSGDFKKIDSSAEKIISLYEKIKNQAKDLGRLSGKDLEKLFPSNIVDNIRKANVALTEYQQKLKTSQKEIEKENKAIDNWSKKLQVASITKSNAQKNLEESTAQQNEALNTIKERTGIDDTDKALEKIREQYEKAKNAAEQFRKAQNEGKQLTPYQKGIITKADNLEKLVQSYDNAAAAATTSSQQIKDADKNITEAQKKLGEHKELLKTAEADYGKTETKALDELFNSLSQLNGINLDNYQHSFEGAKKAVSDFIDKNGAAASDQVKGFIELLQKQGINVDSLRAKVDNLDHSIEVENARMRDIQGLKSRIQYFFGLANAVNLARRAIRNAFNTIKELDKAMTETAVVTDFTVSDMWEQLPEYTKRANELGVTTLAAYQAATLYYQQGLKTNEVNALSVETLKMARIAGLDAAEATDRMTNALRGFNMELTQANAQRVDDVYSELAANTASNVDEISTAMTKVASLAHNANMEFETTAAFLAQIIETTRESAETAGTALKTVVARFSEVKKLVDQNQLRGEDEEGQAIDVNRVGAALRTAGIDLNKYFIGEVGLDDIFMELASKWDSLTSIQQRYIATQAAGSRQQSRFIALMQDYARTQELVGKAYNANGASTRQFAKTQESLESKLNRLKNAWNEFLMGLTNSTVVKTFVDLLTDLLNIVNKLTSAFGDGVGSIMKWGVALGTIYGGKRIFNSMGFNSLLSLFTGRNSAGSEAAQAAQVGLLKNIKASRATNAENFGLLSTAFANSDGTTKFKEFDEYNKIGGLGRLGLRIGETGLSKKFGESKIGKGLSKGLGKVFGFGGTEAAATAATGLATALTAVAGAAAAAAAAYGLWYALSPEGQLKQATKYAEAMGEAASNARQAAEDIKQAQESYKEYTDTVNNAKTTEDYNKAIESRNDYITSLLKENEYLAQYVTASQENGQFVLTINEEQLANAVETASKGAAQASIAANFANALQAGKQADVLQTKLQGVNLETRTIVVGTDQEGNIERRNLTDAEYAKYSSYQQSLENARLEQRNYAKMAYGQSLEEMGIDDEIANSISTALADSFNEDKYLNEINNTRFNNWLNGYGSKKELQAAYYDLYGTQADQNMSRKELAKVVAQGQVDKKYQERADKVSDLLVGENKDYFERLLSAYNGEIQDISLENVANINDLFTEEELGDRLKELAEAMDTDVASITRHINAQIKATKEIQKQTKANIYQKMFESGVNLTSELQKQINQQTPEWREAALDAITGAEDLLNEDLFKSFNEQITNLSVDQLKEFSEFFDSIDLDDPIKALKTLNSYAEDSPFYNYAESIKKSNEELFSTSGLVQSFITSADYESLTEQLADFIKENGEISGKNIEELAKDCDQLNDLLELAEVNTYGLAKAFTLVEKGTIGFESLTDGILKAFSATMTLTDAIDELSSFIDDFDPGRDFGKGADFFHEQAENLQELVDSYEFGNEKTAGIYDALFGEGAYKRFLDSHWEEGPEKVAEAITEKIKEQDYYLRDNSYGFMESFAGGNTEFGTITKTGTYDFEWDIGTQTTEDLITNIQKEFASRGKEISREAAESIISGWAAQSWDFADQLNTNNFNAAIQEWADNLSNTSIISQEQLEAFGKAFNMTADEVKKALKEVKGEANIPVYVKWTDDKGEPLTGAALKDEWDKLVEESNIDKSDFITTERLMAGATISRIDVDKLFEVGKTAGLSNDRIAEIANEYVNDLQNAILTKEITVPIYTKVDDGKGNETIEVSSKNITIESSTFEGLTAAENAAMEAAQYDMVGKIISEQNVDGLGDNIYKAAVAGATSAGPEIKRVIEEYLAKNPITADIQGKVTNIDEGPGAATGGIVRSLAAGSSDRFLQPGFALTGEEGAEIVWNKEKGYAYVTGRNGPQFQNLQPGDRVFNAQETSRIFRNSSFAKGGLYESYANGKTTGGYNPNKLTDSSSGGGGSGSGKDKEKEEKWKNEVDWLYNLVEDIAELERVQTKLQEDYEDYLIDEAKTGKDLYNLLIQQLGNLYTQLDHQTFALEKREQEMREFMDTTNKYDDYLWYNWEDRTLEIDWDQIEAIKASDKETYDEIVDLISEAESIQDKMDDAEDSVMDIKNQIQELENIWRDTFTDFEERVYSAIVKEYQTVIDNYSELNETLNNSNNAILSALQKQISLERQIRDNTKTEEEIGDTEAQLAFLRRDTSSGNELAALQLEQQLNDSRQSYEDNLVDQAISRLQEDNDAAAQQREHQIEIMQAQLDYQSQSGEFNAMVLDLLNSAMGADGELLTNSDLVALLKTQENWGAMSAVSKQVWEEELNTTFKEVAAFLLKQNAEENGTFVTALTGALGAVNATIGSYSQGMMKYLNESSSSSSNGGGGSSSSSSKYIGGDDANKLKSKREAEAERLAIGWTLDEELKKYRKNTAGYATGGLNSQTGLAMLHGTPSEPEYVLNARQTDAFLRLAEVLPNVMSNQSQVTNTFGGVNLNLVMNVDQIASDYDVDRIADRVKDIIYDVGSYRNVNTLNFSR